MGDLTVTGVQTCALPISSPALTSAPSVNSRCCTMPPTCGRISAVSQALVRPGSSLVRVCACALRVSTPTSLGPRAGGSAFGAQPARPSRTNRLSSGLLRVGNMAFSNRHLTGNESCFDRAMLAGKCAENLEIAVRALNPTRRTALIEARPRFWSVMKLSLSRKLFLAVLGPALLATLAMGAADGWSFARGSLGHINSQTEERMATVLPRLRDYYREQRSWDGLREDRKEWFALIHPQGGLRLDQADWSLPVSDLTGAVFRISLLDAQQRSVISFVELRADAPRMPIEVNGQTVGWLVMTPFQSVTEAGGAMLLKRRLLAPVRQVAAATHRLAAGDYAERVSVSSDDEVGQLARDFNQLAHTLERNEQLRREFMADISHELRTPLAVLRGELEALEDGVRKLDGDSLHSLQHEVGQLNQLVNDLHELSMADVGALTYRKQPLDLVELLHESLAGARERCKEQGLTLELQLPMAAKPVLADAARLRQLLGNLMENSLRYTEAGGRLRIRLLEQNGHIVLDWLDSAPGVAEADLPRLFERFFRGEASRGRASGGSGLGLAICRSIAEAHGGTLEAHPSPLGGLWLQLSLPREAR